MAATLQYERSAKGTTTRTAWAVIAVDNSSMRVVSEWTLPVHSAKRFIALYHNLQLLQVQVQETTMLAEKRVQSYGSSMFFLVIFPFLLFQKYILIHL